MIEYIVNKEKRTVVAMIKFDDQNECFFRSNLIYDDLYDVLEILQFKRSDFSKSYFKNIKKMSFPKFMSAKAKCNPEDDWDEEYGKQLARERLVKKIKNYRSRSYKTISDLVEKIQNIINQ